MITPQLIEYVKAQKQKGLSQLQIKESLVSVGWTAEMAAQAVDQIFHATLVPPSSDNNLPKEPVRTKTPRSKKFKVVMASLIIIFLVVFGGGGAYAYRYYLQPPTLVAQKMFANVSEVKSFSYDLDFTTKANIEYSYPDYSSMTDFSQNPKVINKKTKYDVQFKVLGGSDYLNAKQPKTFAKTDILAEIDKKQIQMAAEMQSIDQVIYVRVNKVPDLTDYFKGLDLGFLVGQWVKIDLSTLGEKYGGALESVESDLSADQLKQLEATLKNTNIFTMKERLAGEKINGQSTFHYKFGIEKEGIKKVLTEAAKLTDAYSSLYLESVDDMLAEYKLPDGEIWIGKQDYYPYRIKFSSPLEDMLLKSMKSSSGNKVTGTASMTMNFSNFNEPINLTPPKDYKDLETITDEFSKALYGDKAATDGAPDEAIDLSADADNDGLTNDEEDYYQTDPKKADTDDDGYLDGQEVDNGYNPNGSGKLESNSTDSQSIDSSGTGEEPLPVDVEVPSDSQDNSVNDTLEI